MIRIEERKLGYRRYLFSFGLTGSIYALSGFLLWCGIDSLKISQAEIVSPRKISIAMSQFTPPPIVSQEPVLPPVVTPPKEILPKKVPPIKQKPKQVTPKQQPKRPPQNTPPPKDLVSQKTKTPAQKSHGTNRINELRKRFEQNKFYPAIAKNRGIQGSIQANVQILSNGKMGQLELKGPRIFHAAAKEAIAKSFPLDTRDCSLSLPVTIQITLSYKLTEN